MLSRWEMQQLILQLFKLWAFLNVEYVPVLVKRSKSTDTLFLGLLARLQLGDWQPGIAPTLLIRQLITKRLRPHNLEHNLHTPYIRKLRIGIDIKHLVNNL